VSIGQKQRLCKTNDFQALYKSGMKFYVNGLIFYCKPSVEMQHRIGIIASRKLGGAVVRNTFKRRMRELLPTFLASFQKPHDCILIATQSQIASANFSILQKSLKTIFEKFSHVQHEQTA
jgi:ribonuclease P protein component